MCAKSEGSGETEWVRRLAWAFAGRLCDKYHNLISWLDFLVADLENWHDGDKIMHDLSLNVIIKEKVCKKKNS